MKNTLIIFPSLPIASSQLLLVFFFANSYSAAPTVLFSSLFHFTRRIGDTLRTARVQPIKKTSVRGGGRRDRTGSDGINNLPTEVIGMRTKLTNSRRNRMQNGRRRGLKKAPHIRGGQASRTARGNSPSQNADIKRG